MNDTWAKYLSIASNSAILIGVVLVVVELRQNQTLTRAELLSESFTLEIEQNTSLVGENPEAVLARACLSPDEISPEDILVLKRIMDSRLLILGRMFQIENVAELGVDWESGAAQAFSDLFSIQIGRDYYTQNCDVIFEDIRSIGDKVLANSSTPSCADIGTALIL